MIFRPTRTKGPFTHSIENAVIEVSSTFHRSFMHEFFVEIYISQFFQNIKNNLKRLTSKLHRKIRAWPQKIRWSFDERSMTYQWSFNDGTFVAMCKWTLTESKSALKATKPRIFLAKFGGRRFCQKRRNAKASKTDRKIRILQIGAWARTQKSFLKIAKKPRL